MKLPSVVEEEPQPPTRAALSRDPREEREEVSATRGRHGVDRDAGGDVVNLEWGDVDVAESRFRLRARATKGRRARWVQVPAWLIEAIAATCPLEDRTATRRVFQGITAQGVKQAMGRACIDAGISHFHPHDLRHRRLSLWHGQGVPVKELAERAGHSRASLTLDVYTHVMPLDEAASSSLRAVMVKSR